jgi:hypothetical protein
MGFSIRPEGGHEGRIHEVPQEDRCSSMYIDYYALSSCTCTYSHYDLLVFQSSTQLLIFAIPACTEFDS